jgi:carbamoyl-phosphate synthase large subunit
MPRNPSIRKVMVIGSGPIVIGQAAEFDYAGSQACRSLREEGVEVVLINSNPATIMTDVDIADRVYVEPMDLAHIDAILDREHPDGILPTLGGQTGLNLAVELWEAGIPQKYGTTLLGTTFESIKQAEDRELFKETMESIGMPIPPSTIATTIEEAMQFAEDFGFPLIIRPAYTLGGTGGGIAYNIAEFKHYVTTGISASRVSQVLIEECVVGWKEIEYEVMRDSADNCITVCNMENLDAMGVHTGDSMVIAPSLTLTDREYQMLRSASLSIIRALKICGGCNVQFALCPTSLDYYVIEVNPRVSRSSALASKATGYPIARAAAKIALGLNLDEITNAVTGKTKASFEPALDYVVMKIPRWPFDKFQDANKTLGTQMKATGEVMSIDRTFEGAFMKALSALEVKLESFRTKHFSHMNDDELYSFLAVPTDGRIFAIFEALYRGWNVDSLYRLTHIDPFFTKKFEELIKEEQYARETFGVQESSKQLGLFNAGETQNLREEHKPEQVNREHLLNWKRSGLTDMMISGILGKTETEIFEMRRSFEPPIQSVYKEVDTCAAEFEARSPYYYATYENKGDMPVADTADGLNKRVIVLGGGAIRIGQGIEFDYCITHALTSLSRMGYEAIIINNNPETVSTDFDLSDALFFEPITVESVIDVVNQVKPLGVIVQFGGQTPINLANSLWKHGVKILGTTAESIEVTEDRKQFDVLMEELGVQRPRGITTIDYDAAPELASSLKYPVLVRPSFVLGGRAMEIIYSGESMQRYILRNKYAFRGHPLLIDQYHPGTELEVDLVSDGETVIIPGIMEHIERAGVHSGDSMAVYPPQSISQSYIEKIVDMSTTIARRINACGMINIQYVLSAGKLYVLEVNPRASRTVPFISKVTGLPLVSMAMHAIMGGRLAELTGIESGLYPPQDLVAVKAPVFSFSKMQEVDVGLGPEMKSTGEVMGIARDYPTALSKAMAAAGIPIPTVTDGLGVLITLAEVDKNDGISVARRLAILGVNLYATEGTARLLNEHGIPAEKVKKLHEGRPHIVDHVESDLFRLVINTISDNRAAEVDGLKIRRAAVEHNIPVITSLDTARALLSVLERRRNRPVKTTITALNDIPLRWKEQ